MRTTTLNIFADILQRLINVGAIVGINTTIEMDEYAEEDEEGIEVVVFEAGPSEVYFRIWKKVEVNAQQNLVVDDQVIEDIDDALFEVHSSIETNVEMFCELVTELADAGHAVQTKIHDEDIRIFEIEHLHTSEGLEPLAKFLSRGTLKALYVSFEKRQGGKEANSYHTTEGIPSYQDFLVSYDEDEARYRLYPPGLNEKKIEDALDYYWNTFIPKIQAARREGEVPSLTFH